MKKLSRGKSETHFLIYKKDIETLNNNLQIIKNTPTNKEFNRIRHKINIQRTTNEKRSERFKCKKFI